MASLLMPIDRGGLLGHVEYDDDHNSHDCDDAEQHDHRRARAAAASATDSASHDDNAISACERVIVATATPRRNAAATRFSAANARRAVIVSQVVS